MHLVLFGMVVRLFSVQKERDHYMLAVLSFLMVLAAAVLTVDSVFLFAFAGFMVMAVVDVCADGDATVVAHGEHSGARAQRSHDLPEHGFFSGGHLPGIGGVDSGGGVR